MGIVRFGAPRELLLHMQKAFSTRVFVETGTNKAETTVWASQHFEKVFTIEGFEPLYTTAVEQYSSHSNIRFLLGDTRQKLPEVMNTINEPAIVWLDAHWCGTETFGVDGECPVLDEIRTINASLLDHYILIDDARLFLAPPPSPHRYQDWPEIWEVCAVLRERPDRFIIVYEDVIISGPMSAKAALVDFIRTELTADPNPPPTPLRSILHRLGLR